jgi:hypothetical protein
MKAALLCNGPSRFAYKEPNDYNYVMACNIPWVDKVDGTVILDKGVARFIAGDISKIPKGCRLYLTLQASQILKGYSHEGVKLDQWLCSNNMFGDHVDTLGKFYSSGHMAAVQLAKLGYSDIDVYGCDSYFDATVESYTWQYVDDLATEKTRSDRVLKWRENWNLIEKNFNVKFNFIRS